MLEQKNLDVNLLQTISEITSTSTEKVLKKTVSLKNYVNKFANQNGYIMSNNKNSKYGDDYEYFEKNFIQQTEVQENDPKMKQLFQKKDNFGAYVADPTLNTDKNGVEVIKGRPNPFILENVFDEDFSALYPSIIQALNLAPTSQVGKFFLVDPEAKRKLVEEYGWDVMFQESAKESAKKKQVDTPDDETDLGPALVDCLQSTDFSRIGNIFMGLPTTESMIDEIKNKKELPD